MVRRTIPSSLFADDKYSIYRCDLSSVNSTFTCEVGVLIVLILDPPDYIFHIPHLSQCGSKFNLKAIPSMSVLSIYPPALEPILTLSICFLVLYMMYRNEWRRCFYAVTPCKETGPERPVITDARALFFIAEYSNMRQRPSVSTTVRNIIYTLADFHSYFISIQNHSDPM